MSSALHLLLALFATAYVTSADECTTVRWGDKRGSIFELPVTYLTPGFTDWKVKILIPPQCQKVNGIESVVCEALPPKANAEYSNLDQLTLLVHRNGDVSNSAPVNITVYCLFLY